MDLNGKVAVITGASGGIGSVTALRMAQAGAKVVVGYNSKREEADKVVASLPGTGHRAMRIPMLETAVIRDVAATVERDFGRCDVLVNCAGFTRPVPHADLEALTDDLIDAVFQANVRGPFATIRAFAPLMKKSGDAVIVNISSVAAISGSMSARSLVCAGGVARVVVLRRGGSRYSVARMVHVTLPSSATGSVAPVT